MGSHRTTDQEQSENDPERTWPDRGDKSRGSAMEASPDRKPGDEAEGQLGPDELPDPSEVIMNQEAKLHQ